MRNAPLSLYPTSLEVTSIFSLGILFPSLRISETSVAPQITEELPLCFGSPCWSSCQSCRRRWNGIGSLPVLFRGCRNISLRGNPVIHSSHHTVVPLGGPVLSPRYDKSMRGYPLCVDTTVPFCYASCLFSPLLHLLLPPSPSLAHLRNQAPEDTQQAGVYLQASTVKEVHQQLTFLLA